MLANFSTYMTMIMNDLPNYYMQIDFCNFIQKT